MPSALPCLSFLGAIGAALAKPMSAMPSNLPQQNFTISQCEAMMDGHLPYSTPKDFEFTGNVRRYYVAAEYVTWDYAPSGKISL
jgi:hypothetical protein